MVVIAAGAVLVLVLINPWAPQILALIGLIWAGLIMLRTITIGSCVSVQGIFVAQGPDTADATEYCGDMGAVFIYGEGLVGDCPQVVSHVFPNGEEKSSVPMPRRIESWRM